MRRSQNIIRDIPSFTGHDLKNIRSDLYLKTSDMAEILEITTVTLWRMEKERKDEVLPLYIRSILFYLQKEIRSPYEDLTYNMITA